MAAKDDPLLTSLDASRVLGLAPDTVRYLARTGKLVPDEETRGGQRLYRLSTVERFAAEREKARRNGKTRGRPPKAMKASKGRATKKK